jgi:hypothetical protein
MNRVVILSEKHPSLLEEVVRQAGYCSPIIVEQHSILVDGYRRYLANPEIDVIEMNVHSLFDAASTINRNTRRWDDVDRFLWSRWAESLEIPHEPYPDELRAAPIEMLRALANRKLLLGQAIRILTAPSTSWLLFVEILTGRITLNVNETAAFIDMTYDLANRMNTKNLADVFRNADLDSVLNDSNAVSRQRGDRLLKAMRGLRYPLYQQKSKEKAAAWKALKLDQLHGNRGLFVSRGILEITVRARSYEEMSAKIRELFEGLNSPTWSKLWSE